MSDDPDAWTPCLCPVCRLRAVSRPDTPGITCVACAACGEFCLTRAAEEVLDGASGTIDREQLSEVLCDASLIFEERPLVDSVAAAALIALANIERSDNSRHDGALPSGRPPPTGSFRLDNPIQPERI